MGCSHCSLRILFFTVSSMPIHHDRYRKTIFPLVHAQYLIMYVCTHTPHHLFEKGCMSIGKYKEEKSHSLRSDRLHASYALKLYVMCVSQQTHVFR